MNLRQQTVCAIALWADGYSHRQIAQALNITEEQAVSFTAKGAEEQSAGTMGHMKSGRPPLTRDPEERQRKADNSLVADIIQYPHPDYDPPAPDGTA